MRSARDESPRSRGSKRGIQRRLWALGAFAAALISVGVGVALAVSRFPDGISVLLCAVLAVLAAWFGVRRRGAARYAGLFATVVLLGAAVTIMVVQGYILGDLGVLAAVVASLWAARRAFAARARWPPAAPPRHPVLFYNPLSGGGKAERFHVAQEARKRGIEPIELRRGDDLKALVLTAVHRGADGLAMAGGDGSQAIVAEIASDQGLPYACIPAGTRNHFALDLGVDRDDVVGALDAFTVGSERRVDLAEVNGRVFVNNVSLGLYAEAVQQPGYRDAKLRTLLEAVPEAIGPEAGPEKLAWDGPNGRASAPIVLVSNNAYRLGSALGSGTRPRLDSGQLGIAVFGVSKERRRPGAAPVQLEQWSSRTFEIDAPGSVPAGIDGESMVLDPPLRFRGRAGALRVRIAPHHPGASPSANLPESGGRLLGALLQIALGRPHQVVTDGDRHRRRAV